MTFDEALEELNPRTIWSDEMRDLLEQLRETYAPIIEMTSLQKSQLLWFKTTGASFSTFMFKQGSGKVPSFRKFITTEQEDWLMQAWLHPELIKVIY